MADRVKGDESRAKYKSFRKSRRRSSVAELNLADDGEANKSTASRAATAWLYFIMVALSG